MNYRGHTIIGYLVLALTLYIFSNVLGTKLLIVYTVFYIFSLYMLSPDLDTTSTPYKNWKSAKFLWYPWRKANTHRGFSHTLLGSFTRILYITAIMTLIVYGVFGWLPSQKAFLSFMIEHNVVIGIFLLASLIASYQHIIIDKITTKRKW